MRGIIGGNWKMHGDPEGTFGFMETMESRPSSVARADVVIFPPFTLIPLAASAAPEGVEIGGQDLFWAMEGAYTGEVSARMLLDAGAGWFLAGHSERRHVFGENDDLVRRKLEAGLTGGLRGILCVGETLGEREAGGTEKVVRRQVESGLRGLAATPDVLVIAYEPVWAIGTGLNATPDEADRVHSLIRGWVKELFDMEFASAVRIQYGGSVKPSNSAEILSMPSVDGALVGGASLEAGSFLGILDTVP